MPTYLASLDVARQLNINSARLCYYKNINYRVWFLLKFLLSLIFWWFSWVLSTLGWHQLCLLYSGSCDYMLIFSATLLLCSIHISYLLQNIYLDQIKSNQTIVIFSIKKPLDWQINNRRKKKKEKKKPNWHHCGWFQITPCSFNKWSILSSNHDRKHLIYYNCI